MMKLADIGSAASALGNQLSAGIPLDQALNRMSILQPAHKELWLAATTNVQSGRVLSESLQSVWPDSIVAVVKAGEVSGTIDEMMKQIEETVELQLTLRGIIMQLAYPIGMGLVGLCVFIGFMVFVIPGMSKSIGSKSHSFVFDLSNAMADFAHTNGEVTLIGLGVGMFLLVNWLKTPEARNAVLDTFLGVPIIKDALRDLYFGLWARYMAMMAAAGITTIEALKMTAPVLPGTLAASVIAFEKDLTSSRRPMSECADLQKLSEGDPRKTWWPFYIGNAFVVADHTGAIDVELMRVSPSLLKEGKKTMERVVAIANVVAIAASAALIMSPLGALYTEMFKGMSSIR